MKYINWRIVGAATVVGMLTIGASLLVIFTMTKTGQPITGLVAEMTGDSCDDLVVGYSAIGVVTVEEGDCKGKFVRVGAISYSTPGGMGERDVIALAIGFVDQNDWHDVAALIEGPGSTKTIVVAEGEDSGFLPERWRFPAPDDVRGIRFFDGNDDGIDDIVAWQGDGSKLIWLGLGEHYAFEGPEPFSGSVETAIPLPPVELTLAEPIEWNGRAIATDLTMEERRLFEAKKAAAAALEAN